MKNYAIIGTGAIGGYCAIRLQQAGFNVHCLVHSDYEHVKKQGLTLITAAGETTVPVNVYSSAEEMPLCDVVLITLKTTSNSILNNVLPFLLTKSSHVVVMQNGIGVEREIARLVNSDQLIGASCVLKVSKIAPGTIKHYGFNKIELAQYYPDASKKDITSHVEILQNDFNLAGFECIATEHLSTMRWKKLVGNIPINGLSVVLNASNAELTQDTSSFELLWVITQEVITAARVCGADIPEDFYQYRLKILNSFRDMPKSYSSMKEDYDAKRPLELHAIYENALAFAESCNAKMPLTKMLYQQLAYLDAKNRD